MKGAKDQATAIAEALEGDKPVAFFPEGTTGPGTHLLPFRSTLLEAANYAAKDVQMRPVAIDYGAAGRRSAGGRNRARTMCCGSSDAAARWPSIVHLLDPLDRAGDRKQLAHAGARSDCATPRLQSVRPLAYRCG